MQKKKKKKKEFNLKLIGILKGHEKPIICLVCSEDENGVPLLFSGSEDNNIIKWKLFFKDGEFEENKNSNKKEELILGEPENIIRDHNDFITCLSLNSEKELQISSSIDKRIIVWDINKLNEKLAIENSKSEILAVDNTFNDKLIFSGEKDKNIKLFNLNGQIRFVMKLDGYPTCFLNIIKGKKNYNYLAVELSQFIHF